jgi:hypothetical protein
VSKVLALTLSRAPGAPRPGGDGRGGHAAAGARRGDWRRRGHLRPGGALS